MRITVIAITTSIKLKPHDAIRFEPKSAIRLIAKLPSQLHSGPNESGSAAGRTELQEHIKCQPMMRANCINQQKLTYKTIQRGTNGTPSKGKEQQPGYRFDSTSL